MKKLFLLLMVFIAIVSQTVFSQQPQVRIMVVDFQVDRTDSLLCYRFYVANDSVLKDLTFRVRTSWSLGPLKTQPIPALCLKTDGKTKDTTKWTQVDKFSDSVSSFRYWMAENINFYLPASAASREIMEFYVKVNQEMPQYGLITLTLDSIKAKGVDGGTVINLTTTSQVINVINLGVKPPPDTTIDSVKVQFETKVDRNGVPFIMTVKYQSKQPLTEIYCLMTIDTVIGWASPLILNDKLKGSDYNFMTLKTVGNLDYYQAIFRAKPDQPFPASDTFHTIATLVYSNFRDPMASGVVSFTAYKFHALGVNKDSLPAGPNQSFAVDLGQAPPIGWFTLASSDGNDRQGRYNYFDLQYTGTGFGSVTANLHLPVGVRLADIQNYYQNNTKAGFDSLGNGNYLLHFDGNYGLYKTDTATTPQTFLRLFLSYDSAVTGMQTISISNLVVKYMTYPLQVNNPVNFPVDFGQDLPPLNTFKYYLAKSPSWISAITDMRRDGGGVIRLDFVMDNTTDTTLGVLYRFHLPPYMFLKHAIVQKDAQDTAKRVDIFDQPDTNGWHNYQLIYYSLNNMSPLLPNKPSQNPQAIMQLEIGFVDLPAGPFTFYVDDVMAQNLQGANMNTVSSASLTINFLTDVYKFFLMGDCGEQFGDGRYTDNDVAVYLKIKNKQITPTLYQLWASSISLDSLNKLIHPSDVSEPVAEDNYWFYCGNTIDYGFTARRVELQVYDYLGHLIRQDELNKPIGQYDISRLQLPSGVYIIRLNNLAKIEFIK